MALVPTWSFRDPDFREHIEALRARLHSGNVVAPASGEVDVARVVSEILAEVRDGGDAAAARLASKLDRATITPQNLHVEPAALEQAHSQAEPGFLALMRQAIANIEAYQRHILWRDPPLLERGGRRLGVRYTPIERVAVYVPGGRALYPSTVLMTVVPARVAGVREIVMLSPPTGGEIHPMALALAHELGVNEVIRLGGAVGIAAAAFGTESIRPVNKIVGPGNAFVAEAKRQLFGRVGIDSIAGPSEVFVVADDSATPAWVAADLLAQAEHNPGSAILATPSPELGARVLVELEAQLARLERADAIRSSLEAYAAILITEDLQSACELADLFATEHLQICTRDPAACLQLIPNAGAVFLGHHSPVPLGDYFAGPSHVLPTGGTARFFGPLSCNDFLKSSSLIEFTPEALAEDAPKVADFATREGLTAHARAAEIRSSRRGS